MWYEALMAGSYTRPSQHITIFAGGGGSALLQPREHSPAWFKRFNTAVLNQTLRQASRSTRPLRNGGTLRIGAKGCRFRKLLPLADPAGRQQGTSQRAL